MKIARLTAFLAVFALPAWAEVNIQQVQSPGGLRAWLVEAPEIPFVALEIRFRGGATMDPAGKEGAVALMTGLLEEGTGDLDSQGFAAARDRLAAGYGFDSGLETVSVSARFLTENRDASVDLLRRALAEPRFDADDVERVRQQILASLRADALDPNARSSEAWYRLAFGDHTYARPVMGTVETVTALTVEDLRQAHKDALVRDRVYVGVVGDITAADLGPLLDQLLGGLPESSKPLPGPATVNLGGQVQVEAFDGPQSAVLFGHEGIRTSDPDFFAAFVVNEVLGGGRFGTRLMTEVRDKRGLTYGIGSNMGELDQAALISGYVQTGNATVKQTLDIIRAEWGRIPDITEPELEAAKKYLTGSFPLRWDGNANIARLLVSFQMQGYPIDYPQTRNARIEAVTLDQARSVAQRVFDPAKLSFVVVGQPEGLEQE